MEMLNFTVGPVMADPEVLKVGGENSPYFRNQEFSEVMFFNEKLMLKLMRAPVDSRCIFLTTSGTGAMESCVINILNNKDKVLVINGGSFGRRFVELCTLHHRCFTEISVDFGHQIKREQLCQYAGQDYTALLVNMGETSSGTLYDMKLISDFCKEQGILLIVDAISSFIADELDMLSLGAAAVITGSQKALAVHPGIAAIALAPSALKRVWQNPEECMYLSMKLALDNGNRGQTPFTPAITTLLEINNRLMIIDKEGGIKVAHDKIAAIGKAFRESIKNLPFTYVSESPSNAVTALHPQNVTARSIIETMKRDYHIWICPNGGELADHVFRVGHIGYITANDNAKLIAAFADMNKRGLL